MSSLEDLLLSCNNTNQIYLHTEIESITGNLLYFICIFFLCRNTSKKMTRSHSFMWQWSKRDRTPSWRPCSSKHTDKPRPLSHMTASNAAHATACSETQLWNRKQMKSEAACKNRELDFWFMSQFMDFQCYVIFWFSVCLSSFASVCMLLIQITTRFFSLKIQKES